MQQIVNFLIRNKNFLLFLTLFCLSLFFTIQSHSYHKSKFINSANVISGGTYNVMNNINQYFNLKDENRILLNENNRLKSLLFNQQTQTTIPVEIDSLLEKRYVVTAAKVLKNSYSFTNNYITINKGERDGIIEDLGVVSSLGVIGIIDKTSTKYSRVLSILNSNSRVNAQLKNTNHFGTLKWNGQSPKNAQLTDIQGLANISIGDTIVTSGNSIIFPKGILIGAVTSFKLIETEDVYNINVELFNDMTNMGHVHVINNKDSNEILSLNELNE